MKYMVIMMHPGLLNNLKAGLLWLTADQAAGTAAATTTVDPVNAMIAAATALAAGVVIYIKRHREFR